MLQFKEMPVDCPDAQQLLEELNDVLIGIIGNNGSKHVNYSDFQSDGGTFLIGYEDDAPVCCAGIRFVSAAVCEIKRVYARKNRKGYGRQLMSAVYDWAAVHGYSALILECRDKNPQAIEFYKKVGYAVCESYPPYVGVADAVCMKKEVVR